MRIMITDESYITFLRNLLVVFFTFDRGRDGERDRRAIWFVLFLNSEATSKATVLFLNSEATSKATVV